MNFYMPTRLYMGVDCLSQHGDALRALGTHCLVVTERAAAEASGVLREVEQVLEDQGIACELWDGVSANPPLADCQRAGWMGAACDVDFVLGVGGGSSLDAAKAVAVFAANPTLEEDGFYALEWEREPLPIVLVGTTAGTGSEVTKVAVLTDGKARKHSIHDDHLYATLAFGDSRYTHSCPPAVTLSCGVDILAHAVESYFSRKADEISRAFAVRAVRLAVGPLHLAAAGVELDAQQRRELYEASILGGLSINTTGTCFPHNVGYYLTETYGVPHGFASAAFMQAMLVLTRAYDAAYAESFCAEVGMGEAELVGLVEACLPSFDLQMSEEQIEAVLPRWEGNGSVLNTRAEVSLDDIRAALLAVNKGERFVR